MTNYLFNEQSHIADGLLLEDDFVNQSARIIHCKINYYKFTLLRPSFISVREELRENIRKSLFNFNKPGEILQSLNCNWQELAN